MNIEYRPIIDPLAMEAVVDLHGMVWQTDDREAVPGHMLVAVVHAGGILLGAYDGPLLVGFVYSLPALIDGKQLQWSHEAGVHPSYQGMGIGSRLKWLQRELALARGFERIAWTYDPLQRGNANFNIHLLGCTVSKYIQNVYGELLDGLNAGLPSDRFEAVWDLASETVCRREHARPEPTPYPASAHRTLSHADGGAPSEVELPGNETSQTLVAIPSNINSLRSHEPDIARAWRMQTRTVFETLFEKRFVVTDVTRDHVGQDWYVLDRPEVP